MWTRPDLAVVVRQKIRPVAPKDGEKSMEHVLFTILMGVQLMAAQISVGIRCTNCST